MEMEEGFLLNRVDMSRTHPRVDQRIVRPSPVFADTAMPTLSISHHTAARTHLAPHILSRQLFVESGLHAKMCIVFCQGGRSESDRRAAVKAGCGASCQAGER